MNVGGLDTIFLAKKTAAKNEVALSYHSYHRVQGLYILAAAFTAIIVIIKLENIIINKDSN